VEADVEASEVGALVWQKQAKTLATTTTNATDDVRKERTE
jgi:hypothetical protein